MRPFRILIVATLATAGGLTLPVAPTSAAGGETFALSCDSALLGNFAALQNMNASDVVAQSQSGAHSKTANPTKFSVVTLTGGTLTPAAHGLAAGPHQCEIVMKSAAGATEVTWQLKNTTVQPGGSERNAATVQLQAESISRN